MARIEQYKKLTTRERQNRYFSEEFRKAKVREIEQNLSTVTEIKQTYQVSSTTIYKWLNKYSTMRKKQERQVVESQSDTRKIQQLKEQVRALEQALGQKQLLIDFQSKMLELAEEEYGIDIKKKLEGKLYYGSGTTEENTPTK
jgi:transposase-like protein